MITYRLADIPVAFFHKYPPRPVSLLDYKTEEEPFFSCEVSDAQIGQMADELRALRDDGAKEPDPAFCESFALYLAFAERLPLYGGFLLHAAFLSIDGVGVAILAPSGTGKSTLAMNLVRLLGERVRIVNGDKPPLRRRGDTFFGYGTPFCGKEGRYLRESAPLKKLVFLQRADTDSIRKMKSAEAFPRLYEAVHPPKEPAVLAHLPALLSSLLGSAECYEAALTKDESAAACVYQTLFEMEDRS